MNTIGAITINFLSHKDRAISRDRTISKFQCKFRKHLIDQYITTILDLLAYKKLPKNFKKIIQTTSNVS